MASQESLNVELGEHDEDLSASLDGSISRLQNLLHNDLPWLHHLEEAVELDSMLLRLRLWKTDIKQDECDTLSKVGRVSPHLHSATRFCLQDLSEALEGVEEAATATHHGNQCHATFHDLIEDLQGAVECLTSEVSPYISSLDVPQVKSATPVVEEPEILFEAPDQIGRAICEVCRMKDLSTLKLLLGISDDLDYEDANGQTALDISVDEQSTEATEMLLDHFRAKGSVPQAKDALFKAIERSDLVLLRMLLACGLDPNTVRFSCTPLYIATLLKNTKAIQILLQHEACIDTGNETQLNTALHAAVRNHTNSIMEILLQYGADVNARNARGITPLQEAAGIGSQEIVKLLLQAGADPNAVSKIGNDTPLLIAAHKGHATIISPLIEAGADILQQDREGQPASCIAASRGDIAVLDTILHFADQKPQRDKHGETPLHKAVKAGNERIVALLLQKTPKDHWVQDTMEGQMRTPLHHAALTGNEKVLSLLCCLGSAPTEVEDAQRHTSLSLAIEQGHEESIVSLLCDAEINNLRASKNSAIPLSVTCSLNLPGLTRFLLDQGADVNARGKKNYTALQTAATVRASEDVMTSLLDHGAQVDITTEGFTALGLAALHGNVSNVRFLKEHGKSNLEEGGLGMSQLMWCAKDGNVDAARILLEHGANIDFRDIFQRTPLFWALDHGNAQTAQLLIESGCEAETKNIEDLTPLMCAAFLNNGEVINALVSRGVDLEARDEYGNTALSKAADWGKTKAALVLIEGGADVEVKNEKGWSPLFMATYRGFVGTAKVLIDAGADVNEAWEIAKECGIGWKDELLGVLQQLRVYSRNTNRTDIRKRFREVPRLHLALTR